MPAVALIAILAAGRARRFGADKIDQPCAGHPLGQWAIEAASATGRPMVWIGRPGGSAPGGLAFLPNPESDHGLSTSVAVAARHAREQGHDALLVMLADMPLVEASLLSRLLAIGAPAACRHPDGRPGVPALFAASDFARLEALKGDHGARALLADIPPERLAATSGDALLDVDRPADLARAETLLLAR